jgi:phospholipid-binding lipoprotein MlaA
MALALAACSTVPVRDLGQDTPRHVYDPTTNRVYTIEVPDPFEGFNRGVYAFNAAFDDYVFLPVVRGYRFVLPDFAEDRVSSFFRNLRDVRNAANGLLQLRPEVASRAVMRFAVNSTVGLLGLFDVANRIGVAQQNEDFGQTLAWWGVPAGPYLVLPFLGPSGLRDATGLVADTSMLSAVPVVSIPNELVYQDPGTPALYGLRAVDARHVNVFRYYSTGSPFEYDLVRFFYTRQRELQAAR